MIMKTKFPKIEEFKTGFHKRNWWIVNAENKTLGRLSSEISHILRGKHKPFYSNHVDIGDFVIVTNASKINLSGNKEKKKIYYRHTGYPGGLKSYRLEEMREKKPEMIILKAVKGMMPKNSLNRHIIAVSYTHLTLPTKA